MSLYKDWSKRAYEIENQTDYDNFWKDYLPREQEFYIKLLENKDEVYSGNIKELAGIFGQEDPMIIIGFADGINDSLKEESRLDIENITEDTKINLDVDFESLFYNMHAAKAEWLYTLDEWDNVLSKEKRDEITKQYKRDKIYVNDNKIGRNDSCPCGSGKKYKKCCGAAS